MASRHSQTSRTPLLSARHVGKKYCRSLKRSLWYALRDIAREVLLRGEQGGAGWTREGEFWAVHDVSFDLHPGDALALIGPNGAGKSTLLKMLSGLAKPDTGRIEVRGRIGALIELGAGFDPVLSGRENIEVSAAVLGLSAREISAVTAEIVVFSELEAVIDTPVKYYSSGMNARLSFSVAAHLNPAVFLVDEVLAVGDIDFQRKCINHMLRYLAGGGALILVSHSPYLIQSVCNRGIYIDEGKVQFAGSAVDALNVYLKKPATKLMDVPGADRGVGGVARRDRVVVTEQKPVAIDEVAVSSTKGEVLTTGEEALIEVKFRAWDKRAICWGFTIWTNDQWVCVTGNVDFRPRQIEAGEGTLSCTLPNLPLLSGTYMLKIALIEAESRQPLALFGWEDAPLAFQVQAPATFLNNALKSINQLVAIQVDWGTIPPAFVMAKAQLDEVAPAPARQNGGSVAGAIDLALEFLRRSQKESGEFPLLRKWFEGELRVPHQVDDSVPFATALIAHFLSYCDSPLVKPMIERACARLLSEMEPFGVYRYWPPPRPEAVSVVPDVDDTAIISYVLRRNGVKFPNNRGLLLANRNSERLFYTWIIPRFTLSLNIGYWWTASEQWRLPFGKPTTLWQFNPLPADVDGVVNSNVISYLGPGPETKPVCRYLIDILRRRREATCDKWYLNPFTFYYSVARNYAEGFTELEEIRDELIERILSTGAPDGVLGSVAMESAQAACALLSLNADTPELDATIQHLVRTQASNGSWPYASFYHGGHKNFAGWGSDELTTGFCLQALCRYAKRRS